MSYSDDCYDREIEKQIDAHIANGPTVYCAFHSRNFGAELIMVHGDWRRSDSLCAECEIIENQKADELLARARAEARYSDYLDWCESEKRLPEYLDQREFEEAV